MMKYIAKLFVLPGGTVEAIAEDGSTRSGIVHQANPDGAMFVLFAGEQHTQIVWGPAPKPASAVAAPTPNAAPGLAGKKNAELQAEIKRLQGLVDDADAEIVKLSDSLAKALADLAAATKAPFAPEPAGEKDAPEEKHFG